MKTMIATAGFAYFTATFIYPNYIKSKNQAENPQTQKSFNLSRSESDPKQNFNWRGISMGNTGIPREIEKAFMRGFDLLKQSDFVKTLVQNKRDEENMRQRLRYMPLYAKKREENKENNDQRHF